MTMTSSVLSHTHTNTSATQVLVEDLFDLLRGHHELFPLYKKAVKRVSERKFENHIYGFLRAYGEDLRSEAQNQVQVQAAVFVRRSARQVACRITREMTVQVKPLATEIDIISRKRQVNQWLEKLSTTTSSRGFLTLPRPQGVTTKQGPFHETQGVETEAQDQDGDGIEEEEEYEDDIQEYDEEDREEGDEEYVDGNDEENEKQDSDHHDLHHLIEITEFLTSSQAFTTLTQSIGNWVNPKPEHSAEPKSFGEKETCIQNNKEGGEASQQITLVCQAHLESGLEQATNIDTKDLETHTDVGAGVTEGLDEIYAKGEISNLGHDDGPTITTASFLPCFAGWFHEPRLPKGYRRLRWKCVSSPVKYQTTNL